MRYAAPRIGVASDNITGREKAPSFRAQNPFNSFVPGFGLGQAENAVLNSSRESRVVRLI
ncbi:hypothetical protein AYO50_02750 [Acidobacteria bacterium SCGC AG-212-P17]|nr:hypothetical protein AYO50_02750 [Acidobacteria bacterium SCGC AG-212-P17]